MKIYVKASRPSDADKQKLLEAANYLNSLIKGHESEWCHSISSAAKLYWGGISAYVTVKPRYVNSIPYQENDKFSKRIIRDSIATMQSKYPEFEYSVGSTGSGGYRSYGVPCIWIVPKEENEA